MILLKVLGTIWLLASFVYTATLIDVKAFPFRPKMDLGKTLTYLVMITWFVIALHWFYNLF
jgi:hypothetical protein